MVGQKTWYFHRNPDGSDAGQGFAYPGDVVDADCVCAHTGDNEDGTRVLTPNADYYVNAGMATFVED